MKTLYMRRKKLNLHLLLSKYTTTPKRTEAEFANNHGVLTDIILDTDGSN